MGSDPPIQQVTEEAARVDFDASLFTNVGGSGRWKYTVGLVGKPSAGKSTLFNAITNPLDEKSDARVAAFPFTTIDPNIGQGAYEDNRGGPARPLLDQDLAMYNRLYAYRHLEDPRVE